MSIPLLLTPEWSIPARVRACVTTRVGGCSVAPWDTLNLATHVGDLPEHVAENRRRVREIAALPSEPIWLNQVHGTMVVEALPGPPITADACYTRQRGVVCAVLTADCLPVLLCDRAGTTVAAIHAGWRGLRAGILPQTLAALGTADWLAWIGPGISGAAYEVGSEVADAFTQEDSAMRAFFRPSASRFMADLPAVAEWQLQRAGVRQITRYNGCSLGEPQRFFSHRREGVTGRFASLIWLT